MQLLGGSRENFKERWKFSTIFSECWIPLYTPWAKTRGLLLDLSLPEETDVYFWVSCCSLGWWLLEELK